MIHQVRVIFGDTDQMGVVYYANYLRYFEASRAAYLRDFGKSHADLDAWGVALPVVEAHCRYRQPARYEDLLDIEGVEPKVHGYPPLPTEARVWTAAHVVDKVS